MKDKELKRLYRYSPEQKSYNVDINLDEYRDVYSEWDYSPMLNRDMDEDLLIFLMDCSYEIGLKRKMNINFYVPKSIEDLEREAKSIVGFRRYFEYRIRRINRLRLKQLKNSLTFLLIGGLLMITASLLRLQGIESFAINTLSDGLQIGGWVAIWEIFSIWFFELSDLNEKVRHYKRLSASEIDYEVK